MTDKKQENLDDTIVELLEFFTCGEMENFRSTCYQTSDTNEPLFETFRYTEKELKLLYGKVETIREALQEKQSICKETAENLTHKKSYVGVERWRESIKESIYEELEELCDDVVNCKYSVNYVCNQTIDLLQEQGYLNTPKQEDE